MFDNLFDSIIDATNNSGAPQIVSEQHDVNQIAVEESAIRSAVGTAAGIRGAWDASEYGITAEESQRQLDAANTPEARERVMQGLRDRANRRASLDTSNGKVALMTAGPLPWHRLGTNVKDAVNSEHAMRLSYTDWTVSRVPMKWEHNGRIHTSEQTYAIIRDDTGAQLGHVGTKYRPVQNAHGFSFVDGVLAEFGARYCAAGSLYGGRSVFMVCELPLQAFRVKSIDLIEPYGMFFNPHDGTGCGSFSLTSVRAECANTKTLALAKASKMMKFRHTGDIKGKVRDARQMLGLAVNAIADHAQEADALARATLDHATYFDGLLDVICDVTKAQCQSGADALARAMNLDSAERRLKELQLRRQIKARDTMFAQMVETYHEATNGVNGMRGTAWAGYNAVTEWADHKQQPARKIGTPEERMSRRFESTLYGELETVKQTAYDMALAATA